MFILIEMVLNTWEKQMYEQQLLICLIWTLKSLWLLLFVVKYIIMKFRDFMWFKVFYKKIIF